MTHEVVTQWMGKMQFNALVDGHTVMMDAPERSGGEHQAPIPKPLLLTALSGCTGMDVVALLRKKGKVLDSFDIKVEGTLSKTAHIQYTAIHIVYEIDCDGPMIQDVIDAVNESQEKYCGVSAMLKKIIPVTWEIKYNNKVVYNNKPEIETVSN